MLQAFKPSNLFSHGFGVGDGRAEETVPFETTVQSGPVIVSVGRVWQTPRNQSVVLSVQGVAPPPRSTGTHPPKKSLTGFTVLSVVVQIFPEE